MLANTNLTGKMDVLDFLRLEIKTEGSDCTHCPFMADDGGRDRVPAIIPYVPCPEKIPFILLSRDPTMEFQRTYEEAIARPDIDPASMRRMLFSQAPPGQIGARMERFLARTEKLNELGPKLALFNELVQSSYWTHAHKCPTSNNKEWRTKSQVPGFNARSYCAKMWLPRELHRLSKRTKFIVALGRDAERLARQTVKNSDMDYEVFYLPYSSGPCVSWDSRSFETRTMGYVQVLLDRLWDRFS